MSGFNSDGQKRGELQWLQRKKLQRKKLLKTKNLRKDMIFKEEDLVNSEVDERIYVRESKRRLLNHVLDLADLKSKFRSDIVSYASKNREENTISLDTNTKYDSLGGKIKKSLFYRWILKLLSSYLDTFSALLPNKRQKL